MRSATTPSSFSRRPSTLVNLRDLHQLIGECDVSLQAEPTCLHTLAVRGHACMKAKVSESHNLYELFVIPIKEFLSYCEWLND